MCWTPSSLPRPAGLGQSAPPTVPPLHCRPVEGSANTGTCSFTPTKWSIRQVSTRLWARPRGQHSDGGGAAPTTPHERMSMRVPVRRRLNHGLLDFGPGLETAAFQRQGAQDLPPGLDQIQVGSVLISTGSASAVLMLPSRLYQSWTNSCTLRILLPRYGRASGGRNAARAHRARSPHGPENPSRVTVGVSGLLVRSVISTRCWPPMPGCMMNS